MNGAQDRGTVDAVVADDVGEHVGELGGVPLQRVPHRDGRAEERVDLAEDDAQHDVEREDEEQQQPDDSGRGQQRPRAGCGVRGAAAAARAGAVTTGTTTEVRTRRR